jgi:hypothetical protein
MTTPPRIAQSAAWDLSDIMEEWRREIWQRKFIHSHFVETGVILKAHLEQSPDWVFDERKDGWRRI